MFYREKEVNVRVSKWWSKMNFWMKYSFQAEHCVLGSDSESTRGHAGVGPGLLAAYTVQRMCQRNTTVGVQNVSCVYHNPTTWEDNMGWTCFLTPAAWATLLPVIRRLWETAHPSNINEFILELGGMTKNLYHGIFLNYTGFTVYDGIYFFHAWPGVNHIFYWLRKNCSRLT